MLVNIINMNLKIINENYNHQYTDFNDNEIMKAHMYKLY